MREYEKLNEAKYFLKHLKAAQTEDDFRFNFSALVNAARSVVQFALAEHSSGPLHKQVVDKTFQTWYGTQLNNDLKALTGLRNPNIHTNPIPYQSVTAHSDLVMYVNFTAPAATGTPSQTPTADRLAPRTARVTSATVDVKSIVPTWPHSEDVVSLGERFIDALQDFITNGIKDGILSSPEP
jgi:hypothetical protein